MIWRSRHIHVKTRRDNFISAARWHKLSQTKVSVKRACKDSIQQTGNSQDRVGRNTQGDDRIKRRKVNEEQNFVPAEIWSRISSYLPLNSRATLALTCRRLYDNQVMRELSQDAFELKKFKTVTKFGRLPGTVWENIASYLYLSDEASLAMSCSYFHTKLAKEKGTLRKLERPSNYLER